MATGCTPRDLCVCCGKAVPRSDSRRKVGGKSSELVLPVFVELYEKVFPGKTFLPTLVRIPGCSGVDHALPSLKSC